MKIKVNDYEIEIKAKRPIWNENYNLFDTMQFMNMASIAFQALADKWKVEGREYSAKEFEKASWDIYAALKAVGAYKDV